MKEGNTKNDFSMAEKENFISKVRRHIAQKVLKYRSASAEFRGRIAEIQESDEQQMAIRKKRRQYLKKEAPFFLLIYSLFTIAIVLLIQKHYYLSIAILNILLAILCARRVQSRTHPKLCFSGSSIVWLDKMLSKASPVHRFYGFLDRNLFLLYSISSIPFAVFSLICDDLISAILLVISACYLLICHIIIHRFRVKRLYLLDCSDYYSSVW